MADAGQAALSALERALARRPAHAGEAFAEATEHLCLLRDRWISERHAQTGDLNAIISTVLAGHFPLGPTPWPLIETAATALRHLISKATPSPSGRGTG